MFHRTILRQATRASATALRPTTALTRTTPTFTAASTSTISTTRAFSKLTPALDKLSAEEPKDDDRHDKFTTASAVETGHEGSASRTDDSILYKHPDDESELPSSKPVQGRGRNLRTLASFSLEDKVGVVTGGARGLGLVMSQAMVVSGADVAIVDMNKDEAEKQAAALVEEFKRENPGAKDIPRVTAHYADVSKPDSVTSALNEIIAAHGKIDNLVTSAGFTENYPAIDYPHDRMQKLWGVNVDGTWLFAVGVARHLMERKAPGSIVMIGSMSGAIVNVPQPQAPYNAAKAAVRHMASSLAVEWAHAGVRVNCISPGYMLTALTKKILDDNPELAEKWISLIPQGKMGKPEDLMGAVTFLLSDASGYMTGSELRVDGGYTVT